MAHRNASRAGQTGGEDKHRPQTRAAKQPPAGGEISAATRVAPSRRRPACGPDGEPAGGIEDGGGQPRRTGSRKGALDLLPLDILIVQQWTKTLKGPYDWGDWPLARYKLGTGVLHAAERYASTSARCASPAADQLAWVCAMVACGRAPRLRSLDPQPLLGSSGEQQVVRSDGSRGWRCNVERDTPDGPQLHYWIHPSGLVEFDTVAAHDEPCPA